MQELQETQVCSPGQKMPWRRAQQPTAVFLPGESHGRGAWRATVHVVAKSQIRLKRPSAHASVIQREREDLELAQAEKIPKEDQDHPQSTRCCCRLVSATLFLLTSNLFARAATALTSPSSHITQNIAMFNPWSWAFVQLYEEWDVYSWRI